MRHILALVVRHILAFVVRHILALVVRHILALVVLWSKLHLIIQANVYSIYMYIHTGEGIQMKCVYVCLRPCHHSVDYIIDMYVL